MSKNLDAQIDRLESAVDPNTVISIGGYNFTPAKLMIAGGILSTIVGGMWGAFEVYKDYQDMKSAIQEYVAPDLNAITERISVLEQSTASAVEFTRDINTNLKSDIRRIESVLESVERGQKQSQREVDQDVKEIRKSVDATLRSVTQEMNRLERDTATELRNIRREADDKIKKALDNPLSQN